MARIRTIKPEFWTSEQVVECSRNARLLFIGMLNFADDHGVLKFSSRTIRMNVFGADDDVGSDTIRTLVSELVKNGLVGVYEAQGVEYLHILTFVKHQRLDKPSYKHPAPPRNPAGYKDWSSNDLIATGDLFDGRSPAEGKGMESKGREGKGERDASDAVVERSASDSEIQVETIPAPQPKRTVGTRIHPDWKPDADLIAWAASEGFGPEKVNAVVPAFRDYWLGQPGAKGVKLDWPATFRNWMRREDPSTTRVSKPTNGHSVEHTGLHPDAEKNRWRARMKIYADRQGHESSWFEFYGPRPDQPGCECPAEILTEFGFVRKPLPTKRADRENMEAKGER